MYKKLVSQLKSDIVVQKFGGTSLGSYKRILQVADIILSNLNDTNVIVIASALSPDDNKVMGVTSKLLDFVEPFKFVMDSMDNVFVDTILYTNYLDNYFNEIINIHTNILNSVHKDFYIKQPSKSNDFILNFLLDMIKDNTLISIDLSVKDLTNYIKSILRVSSENITSNNNGRLFDPIIGLGEKLAATLLFSVVAVLDTSRSKDLVEKIRSGKNFFSDEILFDQYKKYSTEKVAFQYSSYTNVSEKLSNLGFSDNIDVNINPNFNINPYIKTYRKFIHYKKSLCSFYKSYNKMYYKSSSFINNFFPYNTPENIIDLVSGICFVPYTEEFDKILSMHNNLNSMKTDQFDQKLTEALLNDSNLNNWYYGSNDHYCKITGGFIGYIPNGIMNYIGRGYSDYTSALIASALKVKELQLWKSVDGILTADPKVVMDSKLLKNINSHEACELSYFGSEVINPNAINKLMQEEIPIKIKNILKPKQSGTSITYNINNRQHRSITGLSVKKDIIILNLVFNTQYDTSNIIASVLRIFDNYGVVVNIISSSQGGMSVSLLYSKPSNELLAKLKVLGKVNVIKGNSILSIVGSDIKNNFAIQSDIFYCLSHNNIQVINASQNASQINLLCIIKNSDADRAVNILHNSFIKTSKVIDSKIQHNINDGTIYNT